MFRSVVRTAGLLLFVGLFFVPPAHAAARVYVRIGPPAPIVEVHAASPHPGYVWEAGYHRYHNGRYEWVAGRWGRAPYAHAVWVPDRWVHERRGYYRVAGHWARG